MTNTTILTYDDPFEIQDERPGIFWMNDAIIDQANQFGLGAYCIAVYAVLARLEKDGKRDPSLATIAEILGCARNTVRTAVYRLQEAGWLAIKVRPVEGGRNLPNLYTLMPIAPTSIGGWVHQVEAVGPPDGHNDDEDDHKKNVFTLYQEIFGFTIRGGYLPDDLLELAEMYDLEWIEEAFKLAVDNEAVNKLAYSKIVLGNWKKYGKNGKPGPKDGDYDPLDAKYEADPWQKNL